MRRLLRGFLPTSRIGLAFWAWHNRYRLFDWLGFGLRAASAALGGRGLADAKAELALRSRIARNPLTRPALVDVRVVQGTAVLRGRATPMVKAALEDAVAATKGVRWVDDRVALDRPHRRFRFASA